MKTFIVLLLSCASVYGADTDIQVVSTTKKDNERVDTKDVFTRVGRTVLVRDTTTESGSLKMRMHRFYHRDSWVGTFVAMPDSSSFSTEPGLPYSMSLEFDASNNVKSAGIFKDEVVLDLFRCTDGIFSPVESSVIQKGNALMTDIKQLLDPEHVRTTSPGRFGEEIEELVEKHNGKK